MLRARVPGHPELPRGKMAPGPRLLGSRVVLGPGLPGHGRSLGTVIITYLVNYGMASRPR